MKYIMQLVLFLCQRAAKCDHRRQLAKDHSRLFSCLYETKAAVGYHIRERQ